MTVSTRVGLYARVSTADKDQNPETQLLPLREFVAAQGWTVAGEYVDHASATDQRVREAWRRLLDDAARRRVDLVLVWRLDRAFRSVHEGGQHARAVPWLAREPAIVLCAAA